jgi:acyl carrier protein
MSKAQAVNATGREASGVKAWIVAWLQQAGAKGEPPDNYLESGILDSFGAIELVEDIERRFSIRFSADDFQDKRFYSVAGVAAMVAEKAAT